MAIRLKEGMRMPVTIGPDGFLCAEDNPGFRCPAGLTDFLVQQKSGDGATLDAAFKQVKKSFAKASSRRSAGVTTAILTTPGQRASTARRGGCVSTISPTSPCMA
jgi:hypothetical protein